MNDRRRNFYVMYQVVKMRFLRWRPSVAIQSWRWLLEFWSDIWVLLIDDALIFWFKNLSLKLWRQESQMLQSSEGHPLNAGNISKHWLQFELWPHIAVSMSPGVISPILSNWTAENSPTTKWSEVKFMILFSSSKQCLLITSYWDCCTLHSHFTEVVF